MRYDVRLVVPQAPEPSFAEAMRRAQDLCKVDGQERAICEDGLMVAVVTRDGVQLTDAGRALMAADVDELQPA